MNHKRTILSKNNTNLSVFHFLFKKIVAFKKYASVKREKSLMRLNALKEISHVPIAIGTWLNKNIEFKVFDLVIYIEAVSFLLLIMGIIRMYAKHINKIMMPPTSPILDLTAPIIGGITAPPTIAIISNPEISFARVGILFIAIEKINGKRFPAPKPTIKIAA